MMKTTNFRRLVLAGGFLLSLSGPDVKAQNGGYQFPGQSNSYGAAALNAFSGYGAISPFVGGYGLFNQGSISPYYGGGTFGVTPTIQTPYGNQAAPYGVQQGYPYNPNLNGTTNVNTNFAYQNGMYGRGLVSYYDWTVNYFSGGYAAFPYYAPAVVAGQSVVSPYLYQGGAFPAGISSNVVLVTPPAVSYLPVPAYSDAGQFMEWQPVTQVVYNAPRTGMTNREQTAVNKAAADIRTAWRNRDSYRLSRYVAQNSRIAVYQNGRYQYSLKPADFLDITRDALRASRTLGYQISTPVRIRPGVFTTTARYGYYDVSGNERMTYQSYTLTARSGRYYITEIGTAPEWRME